jgi:hypothetical protein
MKTARTQQQQVSQQQYVR